jgi:hypothetical protein
VKGSSGRRQRRYLIVLTLSLTTLLILLPPPPSLSFLFGNGHISMGLSSGDSAQGKNSLSYFTSLQTNSTNSLELGYGPGSLAPVSQYVPVYTVNDQLWIQSNYNTPIGVELEDSAGGNLTNQVTISPGTIESYYHFGPALSTTNLTLLVSGSQSFNVSIQFVNPANDTVGTGVSKFSVRNDALFGSIASLNLADKFDIH